MVEGNKIAEMYGDGLQIGQNLFTLVTYAILLLTVKFILSVIFTLFEWCSQTSAVTAKRNSIQVGTFIDESRNIYIKLKS
jgi:hypothetical protein